MQDFIDMITNNLAFFIGLAVFVIFTIGFVLALSTETGRASLGRAAVRLAVAVLGFAERWLGKEIVPATHHPVTQAQVNLQSWLDA